MLMWFHFNLKSLLTPWPPGVFCTSEAVDKRKKTAIYTSSTKWPWLQGTRLPLGRKATPGSQGIHWLIFTLSCSMRSVNRQLVHQRPEDARVTKVLAFRNENPGDSSKQPRSAKMMAVRSGKSRKHGEGKWLSARASPVSTVDSSLLHQPSCDTVPNHPFEWQIQCVQSQAVQREEETYALVPASILLDPSSLPLLLQLSAASSLTILHLSCTQHVTFFCPNLPSSSSMRCL